MDEKRRAKVQNAAEGLLEPGERVIAEVGGVAAKNVWGILFIGGPVGLMLLRRARNYVLTDRNIYVCRSSQGSGMPKEVLLKEPLASANLELTKTGLALNGKEQLFVGRIARQRTREFYELAQQQTAGAPAPAAQEETAPAS